MLKFQSTKMKQDKDSADLSPINSTKPEGAVMNPAFQDVDGGRDGIPGSTYGSYNALSNENPTRSVSTVSPVSKTDYPSVNGRSNAAFIGDSSADADSDVHVYPERNGHFIPEGPSRRTNKSPAHSNGRQYSPTEDRELPSYYMPVNAHRKLLRGEILYVTKDTRNRGWKCWKRTLCIVGISVIVVLAIILASLGATGSFNGLSRKEEILSAKVVQAPGTDIDVHEVQEVDNTEGGPGALAARTPQLGSVVREPKSDESLIEWRRQHQQAPPEMQSVTQKVMMMAGGNPTSTWASAGPIANDGVPEAIEGQLRILNMDFQPALTDNKSWIFQYTSNDLTVYLNDIFVKALNGANYNASRVMSFSSGSVVVKYQSLWNQAPANWDTHTLEILNRHLDANNNFIGNYLIDRNQLIAKSIFYTCRVDNGGCSHLCEFDLMEMRQYCLCPGTNYILQKLTTCVVGTARNMPSATTSLPVTSTQSTSRAVSSTEHHRVSNTVSSVMPVSSITTSSPSTTANLSSVPPSIFTSALLLGPSLVGPVVTTEATSERTTTASPFRISNLQSDGTPTRPSVPMETVSLTGMHGSQNRSTPASAMPMLMFSTAGSVATSTFWMNSTESYQTTEGVVVEKSTFEQTETSTMTSHSAAGSATTPEPNTRVDVVGNNVTANGSLTRTVTLTNPSGPLIGVVPPPHQPAPAVQNATFVGRVPDVMGGTHNISAGHEGMNVTSAVEETPTTVTMQPRLPTSTVWSSRTATWRTSIVTAGTSPSVLVVSSPSVCNASEFSCPKDDRCLPGLARCNGVSECSDGSDEASCTDCTPNFRCVSGGCIPLGLVCDGIEDCPDGSDERERGCTQQFCQASGMFQCVNGYCLENSSRCDGMGDCYAMGLPVDELNCVGTDVSSTCGGPDQFVCNQSRRCIPLSWRCNGRIDCLNSEDEDDCQCQPGTMQCDAGGCIDARLRCNGKVDCPDGYSDEINCYQLQNSGRVQVQMLGDGWRDLCTDGWNQKSATDVCQRLGYRPAVSVFSVNATSGGESTVFWMKPDYNASQSFLQQLHMTTPDTCSDSTSRASVTCEKFRCQSATDPSVGSQVKLQSAVVKITFENDRYAICNGYLVSPLWIVTAASCLSNRTLSSIRVTFYTDTFHTQLTELYIHRQYLPKRMLHEYDFALLKLANTVPSNFVPICLPTRTDSSLCKVVKLKEDGTLAAAELQPVPSSVCNAKKNYAGLVSDSMECRQSPLNLCDEDAASPMICQSIMGNWEVRGFLSYQHHCGYFASKPLVFANLSSAVDWITEMIGPAISNVARSNDTTFVPFMPFETATAPTRASVAWTSAPPTWKTRGTTSGTTDATLHMTENTIFLVNVTDRYDGTYTRLMANTTEARMNVTMYTAPAYNSTMGFPGILFNVFGNTTTAAMMDLTTASATAMTNLTASSTMAMTNLTTTIPVVTNLTTISTTVTTAPATTPATTTTPATGLFCPDGTPLMPEFLCDGIFQCVDGWDEKSDTCGNFSCATPAHFRCPSGRCIDNSVVCDARSQCPNDPSDELGCKDCDPATHFSCLEGRCIPLSWLCDGERDCKYGDDETGERCTSCVNSTTMFKCEYGGGCVAKNKVCDGRLDCPDNSDETDCTRLMLSTNAIAVRAAGSRWAMVCSAGLEGDKKRWIGGVCQELGFDFATEAPNVGVNNQSTYVVDSKSANPDSRLYNAPKNLTDQCTSSQLLTTKCGSEQRGNWSFDLRDLDPAIAYKVAPREYRQIVLLVHVNGALEPCIASVLSGRWLITSYECVAKADFSLSPFDWIVMSDPNSMGQDSVHFIKRFVPHPQVKFNVYFSKNDLLLIELMDPLKIGATANSNTPVGIAKHPVSPTASCVSYGWLYSMINIPGTDVMRKSQGQLYFWKTPMMTTEQCNQASNYNGLVQPSMLCGGFRNATHRSPCMGRTDGAPVLCLGSDNVWELVGIRSYQPPCEASWIAPSVYSNIFQQARWIGETAGRSLV